MNSSQVLDANALNGLTGIGMAQNLGSLSDEALLELSLSSPSAFEVLLGRYQSQFISRAQSVTGSRDTAEDVVQDAFVRIYRFAPRFKGEEGSFRAWSLTILMNVARTHYRKTARERGYVAPLDPDHYESLADVSIVTKEGHEGYAKELIEDAMKKAPDDVAVILRMAFIDDLPYKDIADELGLSVAAVKTRVHRAKATMRDIISSGKHV
jgi:RNA polymerase sigma-70 factor (ECF subfamily)